ncbi:ser/threonine protein phosphatase [Marinithermofilum abyssi]|uniref:Ser/threonine protein phosphatase n=1 Tax=Marinithermofilum abyssi TaxID=1571185 RepID=A0A8J2VBQ8_9BACL|nr:metallophosphoesterase [Marinithermofilum abyssi]GGE10088.1 ser/threonine protein phosphatase [Marinithermofilum abyssi]
MSIYALADLHLSFNKPVDLFQVNPEEDIVKPMDIFGWDRHYERVRDAWLETVTEDDTVLIPGDISWALRLDQAKNDFGWIHQLPGRKVLSPGNHEYYAQSKKKVREALPEGMEWIDADYTLVEDKVVAGTRGWTLPGDRLWDEEKDRKIYERQAGRLRMALEAAAKDHPEKERIVMLHYPPATKSIPTSAYLELLQEFNVTTCVYGHLHGRAQKEAINGEYEGVYLQLVACDYVDFRPVKVHMG